MSGVAAPLRTLGRVRKRFRRRGTRRDRGDNGYLAYALLMVGVTALFPVVRALVLLAASDGAREAFAVTLGAPGGWRPGAGAAGAVLVALAGLGAMRGPVAPSGFWVTLLAAGPIPARLALARHFSAALGLVAVLLSSLGALAGIARGGGSGPILLAAAAGAAFAVISACAWLAGQLLGPRSWVLAAALAALVATSLALGWTLTPWGLTGLAVLGNGAVLGDGAALVVLWALALACLAAVPALLSRLRPEALLQQADAWERVGTSAGLGDISTALGALRSAPSQLRGVRAVRALAPFRLFWVRDLVGAARTPVRLAVGAIALAVLGALGAFGSLGAVGAAAGPLSAAGHLPAATAGAVLGGGVYLALSTLTDGFRHAAVASGAPALYGVSTARLFALHAGLPVSLGVLLVAVGAGLVSAAAVPGVALATLVAVSARAFGALKGPMPVLLATTPISSPAGDPGIIFQLLWRADALLFATAAGAGVMVIAGAGLPWAAGLAIAATLLCVWGTRRRITRG